MVSKGYLGDFQTALSQMQKTKDISSEPKSHIGIESVFILKYR